MTIYAASKVKHAQMWLALRASGVPIHSTWIDEARDKESPSLPDLWSRCIREASTADALIVYVEDGDRLKGGLVEIGAALGAGIPVYVVTRGYDALADTELVAQLGSWVRHDLVCRAASIESAVAEIQRVLS